MNVLKKKEWDTGSTKIRLVPHSIGHFDSLAAGEMSMLIQAAAFTAVCA